MDKLKFGSATIKRLISSSLTTPFTKASASVVSTCSDESPDFQCGLEEKLRESERLVKKILHKVHVSIVIPVYGEKSRVTNPNETFVHTKIRQIESILGLNPNLTWDLALVDDGCPEKTGEFCNRLLKSAFPDYYISRRVKVLFLKDGVEGNGSGLIKGLKSTRKSKKGGAVLFGLMCELKEINIQGQDHILVYTDADLSVHLGQLGLILKPLVEGPYDLAIGSRRDKGSVVLRSTDRSHRGKLFIYFWKRVIHHLKGVYDTQAPFKAFRSEVLGNILQKAKEYGFAFDVEMLLRSEICGFRLAKVPIAFYDNTVNSSTRSNAVHLRMLKSIVALGESVERNDGNFYARFINSLDLDRWERIIQGSKDILSIYDITELESEIVGQRVFEVLTSL